MKTRGIEVIKQVVRGQNCSPKNFGWSRTKRGNVITENDLKYK